MTATERVDAVLSRSGHATAKAMRQHRFVRGFAGIVADVVRYLVVMMVMMLLLRQFAKLAL